MSIPHQVQCWIEKMITMEASDLHLVVDIAPVVRIHGALTTLEEEISTAQNLEEVLSELAGAANMRLFRERKNLDFSIEIPRAETVQRMRVNYFASLGSIGACFRAIPTEIPSLEWARFPESLANRLTRYRNGLILVTGETGSGKTTSLAMLIDQLNQRGGYRIITVEEPVEYVFRSARNSVVTQREVGTDVDSFSDGLKFGLRQDPDVILVGEIRDLQTAQIALSAAETGHLVFATLHTRDAKGAITRYGDFFGKQTQADIRSQLAMSLRCVVSQQLLPPRAAQSKRLLALEVLVNTNPIASAIRSGKLQSIDNYIVTGRSEGMVSMDESIVQLSQRDLISRETAEHFVNDKTLLR